jgi:hypothetical protein
MDWSMLVCQTLHRPMQASGRDRAALPPQGLPTLYVIRVGKTAIGARIEDVSQFKNEVEYVYPPLTLLEPVNEPELSLDGKLSVVHLKITVNQRSTTVEDAEQDRRRFLTRLANSQQWDAKHWARKHQGLVPRLHDQIVGAARRLLDEVHCVALTRRGAPRSAVGA